jgi:hypothetical protein
MSLLIHANTGLIETADSVVTDPADRRFVPMNLIDQLAALIDRGHNGPMVDIAQSQPLTAMFGHGHERAYRNESSRRQQSKHTGISNDEQMPRWISLAMSPNDEPRYTRCRLPMVNRSTRHR